MTNIVKNDKDEYIKYINDMEKDGYSRCQLSLDELNTKIVTLNNVPKNSVDSPISITCPLCHKISVYGNKTEQNDSYTCTAKFTDINNNEMSKSTVIKIVKEGINESSNVIDKMTYEDINRGFNDLNQLKFTFKKSFTFENGDKLRFFVINPNIDIDYKHVNFTFKIDLWSRS